jgi:RNA polymerase sigma-70 factor (ECF subfamily)
MTEEFAKYTDTQLWQAFKNGDENAFDYIFEKHIRILYNYGHKFTAVTEIIEDCVQDLFVELWEKRERLSDTNSIKFYLFKSLRLKIIRRLSIENRIKERDFNIETYDFTVSFSYESNLIAAQLDASQRKLLQQALANLPTRQKEALQLKYYDNLNYVEIASVMGIHIDSVYKLISAALAMLKKNVRQLHLFVILGSSSILHHLFPFA